MFLKVINSDKVKILVEEKDIVEYGLNFENLDYNESLSKNFVLQLLEETYLKTGINFLDSKILIEAVPAISNSFYVIITRLSYSDAPSVNFDKTVRSDEDMYLFELSSPENLFDIIEVIRNGGFKTGEMRLYEYRKKFYFSIDFPPETADSDSFYLLVRKITEYSEKCKWRITNEALLKEWGTLLISSEQFSDFSIDNGD